MTAFHKWDLITILFGNQEGIPWMTIQVKFTFMLVRGDAHPETFA